MNDKPTLNQLLANGLSVSDVQGYWSEPFQKGDRLFVMTAIVLSDGQKVWTEGEHDTPYLDNARGLISDPGAS